MAEQLISPDTRRVPNRRLLWALMALGVLLFLPGAALTAWHEYYDYWSPHWGQINVTVDNPNGEYVLLHTGVNWYECALPVIVGLLIFCVTVHVYRKYYVIVRSGTIVRTGHYRGARDSTVFYVKIEGPTLAGEVRTYDRVVGPNEWSRLKDKIGETYAW